jgi:hypothetical protein
VNGRAVPLALAAAGFVVAVILALLANDVRHWDQRMRSGDLRFQATPRPADLWDAGEVLPFGAGRRLLAIDDDLRYRRAARDFRLGRTREPALGRDLLPAYRARAETEFEEIARTDLDPARRSRALNLIGVLTLARASADPLRTSSVIRETVSIFTAAIELDGDNTEAKANLELVLRLRGESKRGGAEGRAGVGRFPRAGLVQPGSGY